MQSASDNPEMAIQALLSFEREEGEKSLGRLIDLTGLNIYNLGQIKRTSPTPSGLFFHIEIQSYPSGEVLMWVTWVRATLMGLVF